MLMFNFIYTLGKKGSVFLNKKHKSKSEIEGGRKVKGKRGGGGGN